MARCRPRLRQRRLKGLDSLTTDPTTGTLISEDVNEFTIR
jgi:hypothetical protein